MTKSFSLQPLSHSFQGRKLNNHALCLIALATHVKRTKWLPRQWGDALLTGSLWRIVNSAQSLAPSRSPLSGWSLHHWGQTVGCPVKAKPMFRPPCVRSQLSYRSLCCEHNSSALFSFQGRAFYEGTRMSYKTQLFLITPREPGNNWGTQIRIRVIWTHSSRSWGIPSGAGFLSNTFVFEIWTGLTQISKIIRFKCYTVWNE